MNKLLIVALLLVSSCVFAQDQYADFKSILRQVLAVNGTVTKEMHKRFWDDLNSKGAKEEVKRAVTQIKANALWGQEYQKEMWESAKLSFQVKEVVKTQRLIELEKETPPMGAVV